MIILFAYMFIIYCFLCKNYQKYAIFLYKFCIIIIVKMNISTKNILKMVEIRSRTPLSIRQAGKKLTIIMDGPKKALLIIESRRLREWTE